MSSCQYPQEPCSCERKHGKDSLRSDLAFDISWFCDIKDRKLLDTLMDRVMDTIESWRVKEAYKVIEVWNAKEAVKSLKEKRALIDR